MTTFNALRKAGLRAGAMVTIQDVGGLGDLGIHYARPMGFRTFAIGLVRGKISATQEPNVAESS